MSFLSAVGHFLGHAGGDVVKVTNAIQPFAGLIEQIPGVGGPFALIFHTVIQVEALVGDVVGKGADKHAAVKALVLLAYPKLDTAKLDGWITGLVTILNEIAASLAVHNSIESIGGGGGRAAAVAPVPVA